MLACFLQRNEEGAVPTHLLDWHYKPFLFAYPMIIRSSLDVSKQNKKEQYSTTPDSLAIVM